jgi:hypothetical protein
MRALFPVRDTADCHAKLQQTQGFHGLIVNIGLKLPARIRILFHFRAKNVLGMNTPAYA